MALQDPQDSQETKGLLGILVHLVPEETRDRMGYLDLLERKERWGLLELDPRAQRGRKVPQVVLESRVHLGPVDLLAPVVLVEIQAFLVLLDPLVPWVILARREVALKEAKERAGRQEDEGLKVRGAIKVLLVLQVLVSKERREIKEQ